MSEVLEAEIIEETTDLDVTFDEVTISDNLTALSAYVEQAIEPYIGWQVDITDKKRITEAKKVIAELPKLKKKIDAERIRVKKAYMAPFDAWEKRVKAVTDMIENAYRGVKDQIDGAEQAARDRRRDRLEEVYEEFAPALVPMVPFENVLEKEWLRLSMNDKRAEDQMCEKVAKLAKDWEALKSSKLRCPKDTEIEFFRTLDLQAALDYDFAHSVAMEKLAQLKAEIEPEYSEPVPQHAPLSNDEANYRFTIEIPKTTFVTNINEATALKNHLAKLGITARMTKSSVEVAA